MAAEIAQANKWIDRGTAATCAVLVVAICYLLVKTLFLFVDDHAGAQPPKVFGTSSSSKSAARDNVASVDPTAIPLWNLFGKEGVKTEAKQGPTEVVAPKTNLQLELHGVFVATEEDNSTAIISEKRRDSKLYHVGDKLPGGATLAAVREDRVLLNRRGRLEALYFPEKRNASGRSSRSSSLSRSRSSAKSSRTSSRKASSSRTSRRSSAMGSSGSISGRVEKMVRTASSPSEVAEALQKELGVNPADALKEMGLATNNGDGYIVTEAGSPIFAAIGAKPGYKILTLNGDKVGDPVQDMQNFANFAQDGKCKLVVTMADTSGNEFTQQIPTCPQ